MAGQAPLTCIGIWTTNTVVSCSAVRDVSEVRRITDWAIPPAEKKKNGFRTVSKGNKGIHCISMYTAWLARLLSHALGFEPPTQWWAAQRCVTCQKSDALPTELFRRPKKKRMVFELCPKEMHFRQYYFVAARTKCYVTNLGNSVSWEVQRKLFPCNSTWLESRKMEGPFSYSKELLRKTNNFPILHRESPLGDFFWFGTRNPAHTGQLNPLFHIFVDLVNRVVAQQVSDWSLPNSQFSPNGSFLTRRLPTDATEMIVSPWIGIKAAYIWKTDI